MRFVLKVSQSWRNKKAEENWKENVQTIRQELRWKIAAAWRKRIDAAKHHLALRAPSIQLFFSLTNLRLVREVLTGVYRRIYRYRGLLTRNGIKSTCRYPIYHKIIFYSSAVPGICDSFTSTAFLTAYLMTTHNPSHAS